MQFYKFTVVITPDKDDTETFNVSVPAFSEIATFGNSVEEAKFMAQDALELVILSTLEEGEVLPKDKKPKQVSKGAIVEEVVITVSHTVEATPASHVKHTLGFI